MGKKAPRRRATPTLSEGHSRPIRVVEVEDRRWKFDRHVSLPTLLAVVIQTASLIWYVAKLDDRVVQLEKKTEPVIQQAVKLVELQTKFEAMNEKLGEIRDTLRGWKPTSISSRR